MAATKLLLVKDVEDLGRSGQIVSVKPGYARNKLLPSGLAVLADKKALRMQARLQEQRSQKALADKADSEQLKTKLEEFATLTKIVKVDHEGNMYGSVTAHDIVTLLQEQASIEVEKRFVQLKHPLKKTGSFDIHLKLNEGVTADIKLNIEPEQGLGAASHAK